MTHLGWLMTKLHNLRGYMGSLQRLNVRESGTIFLLIFLYEVLWFRARIATSKIFEMLSQSHRAEQIWLILYRNGKSGELGHDCWYMHLYHHGITLIFFFLLWARPMAYGSSPGQGVNPSRRCYLPYSCGNIRSFKPWHHSGNSPVLYKISQHTLLAALARPKSAHFESLAAVAMNQLHRTALSHSHALRLYLFGRLILITLYY